MLRRPTLHRLDSWLGRFRRPAARDTPGAAPAEPPGDPGALPVAEVARGTLRHEQPRLNPAGGVPAVSCPAAPRAATTQAPASPLSQHERGRHLVAEHRWNLAQRELERAARAADGAAAEDLASVREVRRQLRVLGRWPRDIPAHLALGRAYFELGLGADAEATFRRVLALAPAEPTAPYFLALEYAFRGAWPETEDYYARARTLAPDLPPFADWLNASGAAEGRDAEAR